MSLAHRTSLILKAQADENLWLFQQAKSALVKISELDATLVAEDLKRVDALI